MTAFVGIGCSFGGKWFGGMARSGTRNYAANAKNSLLQKVPGVLGVEFIHGEFHQHAPKGALVYCDPPYADTTSYKGLPKFDHALFWGVMRKWVVGGNTVCVSEYAAPPDFPCVLALTTKTDMHTRSGQVARVEKVFMHESQVHLSL